MERIGGVMQLQLAVAARIAPAAADTELATSRRGLCPTSGEPVMLYVPVPSAHGEIRRIAAVLVPPVCVNVRIAIAPMYSF